MKTLVWGPLAICIHIHAAIAGTVSIPLEIQDTSKRPADDLVYQNNQINSYQAFKLKEEGIDLAELSPYESHLWQDQKHPLAKKLNIKQVHFEEFKASPREFFRAKVSANGQAYVLTASLDNHTNIIRANLLRSLGYDIQTPSYYQKMKVSFRSEKDKELFKEELGSKTLTNRKKWFEQEKETELIVKNITLAPAKLNNVNLATPVMSYARQEKRRIFRALLAIYALTDFPQSINAINWELGSIFNQKLMLQHPYANEFRSVSREDLIWITKRMLILSRDDFSKIIAPAGYPKDIQRLIKEKLIGRLISLAAKLKLAHNLTVNKVVNNGSIKNSKLTYDAYPESVVEFYKQEADSPYEFDEMFRLFRTQATYNALSTALSTAVEKFVPAAQIADAAEEIQDQITEYRLENQKADGSLPLKVFSYPTAYLNTHASRNIVFGKFMDNSAPIQLVDSVSADLNLGVYTLVSGLDDVTPSLNLGASYSRSYTHVRAMPDLNKATSQSLKKVLVPKLMGHVARMVKDEYTCSLTEEVNIVETELNNNPVVYIKYELSDPEAKKKALAERAELIANGTSEDIILLVPVQITKECEKEIRLAQKQSLKDFVDQFALNETFMINDSINLLGTGNATIPLDQFLGQSLSLSISGEKAKGFIRSVSIRKKDDYFEITIQKQNDRSHGLGLGINYFIEIVKHSQKWLQGKLKTAIYKVPLETEENSKLFSILRELFISKSTFELESHFSPIILEHDTSLKLNTFKALWYKSEALYMDHHVEMELPQSEYPELSLEQRSKNLFSTSSIRRNGKDLFGFFNTVLGRISRFINLGSGSQDPGQNIRGSSKSRYYTSEMDLSSPEKSTTKIEYVWKGWSAGKQTLNHIFNFIESIFPEGEQGEHINRDQFEQTSLLRGYEVKTTMILYPSFYQQLEKDFIHADNNSAMSFLKKLYGEKKWKRFCTKRRHHRRVARRSCTPRAAKTLLKIRKSPLTFVGTNHAKKMKSLAITLLEGFDRKNVISWLGTKNLFINTRVIGFLENSERGYIDYISNTYGEYQTDYGTGVFDQIGQVLGLSPYELRALNYTPGM